MEGSVGIVCGVVYRHRSLWTQSVVGIRGPGVSVFVLPFLITGRGKA